MSEVTLYEYLAFNVPEDCQDVLSRYDVPLAQSVEELTVNLKQYVRVYGQDALEELADIHPDKDLIMEMAQMATPFEGKKETDYLNASGANDRLNNIEKTLMSGSSQSTPITNDNSINKMDVVMGIGIAILTATLFKK